MKKQDLYRQTIQRWGREGQIDMFHEEVGELLSALNKYNRGRVPANEVVTEIADVQIMAEQLAEMFGGIAVQHEKMRKLDRLARRVQKAALQEVDIEVTDDGEPMERFKNRMSCKHCGMEDICLLRSHHGPNGGITMSCNMFVRCRRNQNWDREHQFQIATVGGGGSMSKTRVVINAFSPYGDYKKGDRGIADGYCRGGNDVPCAVVIIGTKFVCVPVYALEFDGFEEE